MKLSNHLGTINGLDAGHSIWLKTDTETIVILERNGRFTIKQVLGDPGDMDHATAISTTIAFPNVARNWEPSEADRSER